MNFSLTLLFSLLLFWAAPVQAQEKYEREVRLKEREVPQAMPEYIRKMFPDEKIKWYRELSAEGFSYEAKVKFKGQKYSVEFDSTGNLEDVEQLLKVRNLPDAPKQEIDAYLKREYEKVRISRLQLQLKGEPDCILQTILNGRNECVLQRRYEAVIHVCKDNEYQEFEFLFDKNGKLLEKRKVVQSPDTHLVY